MRILKVYKRHAGWFSSAVITQLTAHIAYLQTMT